MQVSAQRSALRRMAKDNIDYEHSIFRTIDLNTRRVGETKSCIPPKGVGAGLYSMKIVDGQIPSHYHSALGL